MSDPAKTDEPSMEDILASIKKIIAEDGKPIPKEEQKAADAAATVTPPAPPPAAPAAPPPPKPEPAVAPAPPPPPAPKPAPELKPEPQPEPAPPPPAEPKPIEQSEDILELTEFVEDMPAPVAPPADIGQDDVDALLAGADINTIIPDVPPSPPAVKSQPPAVVSSGFAPMATAMTETAVSKGWPMGKIDGTMEEMIREILKPLLNQWLEANLQPITEKLVQAEIEKTFAAAKGEEKK